MSLNRYIAKLSAIDMRSDETVIFHAVESKNRNNGDLVVKLFSFVDDRDEQANIDHRAGYSVSVYEVICPFNTDIDDAQSFAYDNARLNG
jgi:hypothetical protein